MIGELFAGVVLGSSLLRWIAPSEAIRLMAGIGIILLLFEVGLETDVKRLVSTGVVSVVVVIAGFILPFLFGFGLAYGLFELSLPVSLFIGGTLTATRIGITVRVLSDLKRQHSKEGQVVLGAEVLDDVMGVVLLALLYEFSIGGGVNLVNTGKVLIFVAAFFVLSPVAAKFMLLVIKRFDARSEIQADPSVYCLTGFVFLPGSPARRRCVSCGHTPESDGAALRYSHFAHLTY